MSSEKNREEQDQQKQDSGKNDRHPQPEKGEGSQDERRHEGNREHNKK